MVKGYRRYGIYNEEKGISAEAGDDLDRIEYWDNEKKVTLENVTIEDMDDEIVTIELEDGTETDLKIEDIIDFD